MKLKELKINTFSLIEEYYPELKGLAEDEDVLNKIDGVINNVSMDIMRFKKIPANKTINIKKGTKTINFEELVGKDFYQLNNIIGLDEYETIDDVTISIDENFEGEITIYYYKLPKMVEILFSGTEEEIEELKAKQDNEFEFDLPLDVLHIMPYGIAADLLKMDMISGYGRYFYERYMELKNSINPKRTSGIIRAEGGVDI